MDITWVGGEMKVSCFAAIYLLPSCHYLQHSTPCLQATFYICLYLSAALLREKEDGPTDTSEGGSRLLYHVGSLSMNLTREAGGRQPSTGDDGCGRLGERPNDSDQPGDGQPEAWEAAAEPPS